MAADGLVVEVASGDRRRGLEALRDRLAVEVERVSVEGFCPECKRGSSNLAPLAKQLADVLGLLEAMPKATEGTPLDELERRRKNREPGTSRAGGAAGS